MLETLVKDIIPLNDEKRVEALQSFNILYTSAEKTFDNITQIMARMFQTPMAFISLVDKDKVFYKSQTGPFGRDDVQRTDSLCSLTILNNEPLVIEDASNEVCFQNNPYVLPEGGIKFYAGAPLITKEGYHIGTACIVDTKPRTFSEEDKLFLVRFAQMVMHEIEVRHASFVQIEIQQELYKAQAQLAAALEVGKITPWHWDAVNNKVFGGAELARMFGVSINGAVQGLPIEMFIQAIHRDDQPHVNLRIKHAIETGEDYEAEYRVFDIDKKEHWVLGRGRAKIENNVPVSLTGSLIDITDRKEVEATLAESEERFRTLANSITQLAWIADADGWIQWYNDRWYDYTGTTLEEMKGWGWEKVHHPDYKDRVVSFAKEVWQKGEPWEIVFPLKNKNGEYRWFLTRGVPVKNKDGKVIHWIGTNTDINEHKQAEALLEQRVKERTQELELRNRELEQFTYVSHHDLQEPLRKIAFFSDLIKNESYAQLSESSKNSFDKIINAAQRMSVALKDVLNYASLSKEEQYSSVDLNSILTEVQIDLELLIKEKEAKVYTSSLPVILAVPLQMHQLFYNLLSNALKFAKPEVPPEIHITCRMLKTSEIEAHSYLNKTKQYYQIHFQDNGIGFNPESADKIFGMFQRLHNRTNYSGTGIGLALCKKVVANHGGKIWAESSANKGATFIVVLPTS